MSDTIIKLENISKQYRLGQVGTQTLRGDFQRWWHTLRGKEDPTLKIGASNKLDTVEGEYVWALRDINLEVKQGEVLGIIGKNGAGKSTLLKLLSRVTGPTTGQIKVKGRIASLLEVGTGFHPELTGRENIFLNGAILGMTKAEIKGKFDEIVDFAGVAKYIDTPVKRYSSGMYVRLAFAVAAHLEPDILVVDEVLAVGDAEFQKKAIGKMQDISTGGGRTVLFVSHNMAAIKNLCLNSVLMNSGNIVFHGESEEAIFKYLQTEKQEEIIRNYNRFNGEDCQIEKINLNDGNLKEITNGIDLFVSMILKSKLQKNLTVVMDVYRNGVLSFASANFHHVHPIESPGKYKIVFKIPKYLLNPGFHHLDFYIVDETGNFKHYLYAKHALSFTIYDDNYRRGSKFSKNWNGSVSPILEITVNKITNDK